MTAENEEMERKEEAEHHEVDDGGLYILSVGVWAAKSGWASGLHLLLGGLTKGIQVRR